MEFGTLTTYMYVFINCFSTSVKWIDVISGDTRSRIYSTVL